MYAVVALDKHNSINSALFPPNAFLPAQRLSLESAEPSL